MAAVKGTVSLLDSFHANGGNDPELRDVCALLLTKISDAAAVVDDDAAFDFKADVKVLAGICSKSQLSEDALRTADVAVQLLEDYNRDITMHLRRQQRTLANLVKAMADTVASVAPDDSAPAQRLRKMADRLVSEQTAALLEELNQSVSHCLHTFREEMLHQKAESDRLIISLRREIESGPQTDLDRNDAEVDHATNLPQKHACIQVMNTSIESGKRRFVAVIVLTRLRGVNLKFGRDVGDRVLCRFAEHVEQQILPTDQLFRWNGPTLVAVMDRNETLERVRAEVRRMVDLNVEEVLTLNGREVTTPIAAEWFVFQLLTTVHSAEKQINTIAARHAG